MLTFTTQLPVHTKLLPSRSAEYRKVLTVPLNVVAVVGRVRDGFSSKPDVAASFLPTVAAVADHF